MNPTQTVVPVPKSPEELKTTDEKRLWIGNLDPRINEYQLLKLMQKHGAIEKFDLLFHRSGPLAGQPRGYAFITYDSKEAAVTAKNALHNKLVGNRRITVTWAHSIQNQEECEKRKPPLDIPCLAGAKSPSRASRETQIQAIEAKLKMMESSAGDELVINKTLASETPVVVASQRPNPVQETGHRYRNYHRPKPYHRPSRRK